jgi:ornithine decarboxylase
LHSHHNALGLVAASRPVQPVTLLRPHAARRAARFFVEKFPGKALYAVKANPSPDLIAILWESGITHFDTASIAEIRLVRQIAPEATSVLHAPGQARRSDPRGLL